MHRTDPASSFFCTFAIATLLGGSPALAQTGRSVALGTSPNLGALSSYTAIYPPSAAGRVGAYGMTLPFAGAVPLSLPGFTSNGLVRIDLANILVQGLWLLDGTGSFSWTVSVPTLPALQGLAFDVQTLDIDLATSDFAWGDNELTLMIGPTTIAVAANMVWIPAGTFSMGSPVTPLNVAPYYNQPDAQPVHSVTITRPFWIGKHEVTQAEYQAVMGSNPSGFVGPQRPVEQVSWNDAMAYCAALTVSEAAAGRVPAGYQYRLPTEAEWEYCCRAGTTTEYWCGQAMVCWQAHFFSSFHSIGVCGGQWGHTSTTFVGSYVANPWGLHDVAGNVLEWCFDSWDGLTSYPAAAVSDPYVSSGTYRIFRGGSWRLNSSYCRAAMRTANVPGFSNSNVGFRVVLAPILP